MNIVPNINANVFTFSAIAVGYLLIDQLTPAEQNSLGNWFMLVGQVLATNASQQQVLNNRNNMSNSSNMHVVNDNNLNTDSLQKAVEAMKQEIERLKKSSNI